MQVNERLAAYIKDNGIKYTFICEKTGISKFKLSRILNSKTSIDVSDLKAICEAINVKPAKFI